MTTQTATQTIITCDCGHPPSEHLPITTGYGIDSNNKTHCYACIAELDKQWMIDNGNITLYLNEQKRTVSNWPGSLTFHVKALWKGYHNFFRCEQVFARFIGPDGKVWSGKQVTSGYTQLINCKRTKISLKDISK
jgi:hypothetical protein